MRVVEIAGCSGAGKSTLARHLVGRLEQRGIRAAVGEDLIARLTRTDRIRNDSLRNVAIDLLLSPMLPGSWIEHRDFLRVCFKLARRCQAGFGMQLSRARSIARRLNSLRLFRRSERWDVVFMDEGLLGSASTFARELSDHPALCEQFLDVVPLADAVLFVQTPLANCLQRTETRSDRPLHRSSLSANIEFVTLCHGLFATLAAREHGKPDVYLVGEDVQAALTALEGFCNHFPNSGSRSRLR